MLRRDQFPKAAAECVALAQSTPDPNTRTSLLLLAQMFIEHAGGSPGQRTLAEAIDEFNAAQMLRHQ